MIRVVVDTQSNRLFRGSRMEQNYDQRGGLCQVGDGNIVITTNPIDPNYLDYWCELGFTLPNLMVAGPYDSRYTLSDLIVLNGSVQDELESILDGRDARLEFFCIEETERLLTKVLGIKPYCSFDVSIALSRKYAFKLLCEEIGLPTPLWDRCEKDDFQKKAKHFLAQYGSFLVKSNDGTGGVVCRGMGKVENLQDIEDLISSLDMLGNCLVLEKIVQGKRYEASLHWEIDESSELRVIGIFGQLSDNFGYSGSYSPIALEAETHRLIINQLIDILSPALMKRGALGFFCCDLIIDDDNNVFWIDLNPRKGAIIYTYSMVERLSNIHFGGSNLIFFHQHCPIGSTGCSFEEVRSKVSDLLVPSREPFVVITNPGVIEFGYVDITGISLYSVEEARSIFEIAKSRLLSQYDQG